MRWLLLCLILLVAAAPLQARPPKKKTPMDQAVDKALEFLHNTQNKSDGSWTGGRTKHVGVSSLAVMAFLSAGHVPGEGKYGKTIERGVKWVMEQQRPNGLIASEGGHEMYHHGIATLMLCEVCGMLGKEKGKEVRKAVEKAVAIILKAQRSDSTGSARGGWRYRVAHYGGSDISVTGWQVMALRAAKNLGCDVPAKVIERAVDYIKRCQEPRSGGFRYMPNAHVTVPCTGTSILALELCGKDQHKSAEVLKAGAFLIRNENLPRWGGYHFSYSIYYGAQATFQLGGNYWSTYRSRLHFVLLRNQGTTGSWLGGNYESNYGPNYSTAMAVLALTVEYRFLPIYQRGEEPGEKEK
jgi:squalene cyclase